jgi:uncharacterized protein
MSKLLKLSDKNGIQYVYDNNSGFIFLCDNDTFDVLNDNSSPVKYNDLYFYKFKKSLDNMVNENTIEGKISVKERYEKQGFSELIFKLTAQCNMRCSYCIYSKYYPYSTNYSDEMMTFSTAKRAIDIYMEHFIEVHKKISSKEPTFAFYGGEPLINFKLIVQIIEYVENVYSKYVPRFTITTNGLLLDNENISFFLKNHNVSICLSIDGFKDNHDRNRVDVNRKPTYDKILEIIQKYYKDYSNIYICLAVLILN